MQTSRYIVKRILLALVSLFAIITITYFLMNLMPGDPFMSEKASEENRAILIAKYGLDQPVYVQYLIWLKNVLSGNLGTSYRTMRPVAEMVAERIGPTLMLTVTALIIALVIAIPLGIISAYKPYSAWDYGSSVFAFIGAATPNFFAAMILIYVFSIKAGWLPTSGMYDVQGPQNLATLVHHIILPVITLMLQYVGIYTRYMRSSMLEVLSDDYIRTARAKGLREKTLIFKHALKKKRKSKKWKHILITLLPQDVILRWQRL